MYMFWALKLRFNIDFGYVLATFSKTLGEILFNDLV